VRNPIREKEFLELNFPGIYRATVIDNTSTDGSVKVLVHPMMNGISESDLPWAVPAMPVALANSGIYGLPAVDSTVWVFFDGGDLYSPVYFAGAPCGSDWPSTVVDGTLLITTPSGQVIKLKEDEGLTIEVVGDVNVTATGNVNVSGALINLN
jgi:hypothetical protein